MSVTVVFNSFNGRYADNPRAIFEALQRRDTDAEHIWLQDPRFALDFPAGIRTVPIGTPDATAALETATLIIANCHLTLDQWRPRPDAVYLQTWHGTPLKRIHRSAIAQPNAEVMAELDADIDRWNSLIAPSRVGGQLLRKAFGYPGPLIESGYPRNDVLSAPDRDQRRAAVRENLGLADTTTAVLYAPTYRDDDVSRVDGELRLDPARLIEQLGSSYHLLLRQHYYLSHRPPVAEAPGFSDVSTHGDIADLLLAADVLVTDYSSVMFDFAVTGRPIVLYADDLEHYQQRLRGFTFDLRAEAPGPIVSNQDDVAAALSDLPKLVERFESRLTRFRDRYCHFEDGHATDRVLAALGYE